MTNTIVSKRVEVERDGADKEVDAVRLPRSAATPDTAAAQEDTGAIMQMGAAVASMM